MGFLLFLIAMILTVLTVPLGMLFSIFKFAFKGKIGLLFKMTNGYFYKFALAIDQMGNVAMQDLFNEIFIIEEGYKFGNEDETISSVLGKNQRLNTLSRMGIFIVKVLNFIDKNHALDSIEKV